MRFKAELTEFLRQLRASYWFIPSSLAILSIIASQAAIGLDESFGASQLGSLDFLYANKPSGARVLLSTIAGSMIGVAGVAFSITIAAVAYASAQFGPRIIDNFMKDRGNQFTLGVFIATFLYCLLVMRIIRVADDDSPGFVPHISVFIAVLFALASLGFLIFFLHHVPKSIHISKLVSSIGHEALEQADTIYPETLGQEADDEEEVDDSRFSGKGDWLSVRATAPGHIQMLEGDALLTLAKGQASIVDILVQPGDFVVEGQELARFQGEAETAKKIGGAFLIGDERSPTQDLMYLSDQLIDIAGRALSPGINDARSAKLCISWLHALLAKLGEKSFTSSVRTGQSDEHPVVRTKPRDFHHFADSFYDQLRPYVQGDRNAAFHTLELSLVVMRRLTPKFRKSLYSASFRLLTACRTHLEHPSDQAELDRFQQLISDTNSAENQLATAVELG